MLFILILCEYILIRLRYIKLAYEFSDEKQIVLSILEDVYYIF